jgi:hypothetical protein
LFRDGDTQANLYNDALTWRLAACLRGLECGPNAEWHLQFCLHDPTCLVNESGKDYLLRTATSLNLFDIEQKAKRLNEAIDQGDWKSAGLGS